MTPNPKACTIREAVGVFDRPEDLEAAIDELLKAAFLHSDEVSLLAGRESWIGSLHIATGNSACPQPIPYGQKTDP